MVLQEGYTFGEVIVYDYGVQGKTGEWEDFLTIVAFSVRSMAAKENFLLKVTRYQNCHRLFIPPPSSSLSIFQQEVVGGGEDHC